MDFDGFGVWLIVVRLLWIVSVWVLIVAVGVTLLCLLSAWLMGAII